MKKKILSVLVLLGVISIIIINNDNEKNIIVKDNIDIRNNTLAMYKSEDGTNYTEITEMPESGYIINEQRTYCTMDNKTQIKGKVKSIEGNTILTNIKKNDKCYLYFDKQPPGSEIILGNITVKPGTPDFSKPATTDEGVYKVSDPVYGGYSYYWRGAVTNNYVKFGGFCWRIVRINGDKTMRLIYDGTTCHANGETTTDSIAVSKVAFNSNYNQSNHVGWTYSGTSQRTLSGTSSNAKTQLESWYSTNITGINATKVAQGKYCNDRNAGKNLEGVQQTWTINGSLFYYASMYRLVREYAPTLSCPTGDVYTLNVGLITADEISMAGERSTNKSFY